MKEKNEEQLRQAAQELPEANEEMKQLSDKDLDSVGGGLLKGPPLLNKCPKCEVPYTNECPICGYPLK